MRIDVLTCVPELLASPFSHSILQRAQEKGLAQVVVWNLRDFTSDRHRQVDDYQFGGGAGMVMKPEPIFRAVEYLQNQRHYAAIAYTTPDGQVFDQEMANYFSLQENLLILAGHYKGVDERVRERLVTHEISIGDYVLSGGELAAAVIADAVIRLVPGVLGNETSALTDSFQDGLLAPPVFTRPAEFRGMAVPDILRSGHEAKIAQWRHEKALERTRQRRPDLLKKHES